MASQSTDELVSSGHEEPTTRGLPSVKYLDPTVYPWQTLGRCEDQTGSRGPSPRDNPQPQDLSQGSSNVRRNKGIRRLLFPRKLWRIVEDDAFTSVHWSNNGQTVVIDEDLFKMQVLCQRGAQKIFESNSLKSFIRQMNRYGFKKVCPYDLSLYSPENDRMLVYHNSNFQRDKPWLIDTMKSKRRRKSPGSAGTSTTPAKKGEPAAPQIPYVDTTNADNQKDQESTPDAQGPRGAWLPFQFSGLGSPSHAMGVHGPTESGGPSGEGTSRNNLLVPVHTAETDRTGEGPSSAPDHPHSSLVMVFYPMYSPILSAAAPVMVPPKSSVELPVEQPNKCPVELPVKHPDEHPDEHLNEHPDEDDEQSSSMCSCALCMECRDNVHS